MKFEEAYKRLNEISDKMDDKDLSLEEALSLYSEAAKLVDECKRNIENAKLQIERIENGSADGQA